MRFRCAFLCALGLSLLGAADAGITHVRHVYLLPMGGGLDQYLASQLTRSGFYKVVTDPQQADALLTDRIGADFESRVKELYPPPEPPETAEAPEERQGDSSGQSIGMALGENIASGTRISSFSRGRGNVFLVDRESRRVLWSTYLRPRNTRPDELNRIADQMVDRLESDLKRETKRATQK